MQQGFPITVRLDERFSQAGAITENIEAWINFQALTAGWYADESCVLSFDFIVVSDALFVEKTADLVASDWVIEPQNGLAFCHNRKQFQVKAFIALGPVGFEDMLKMKLVETANRVVREYGFEGINA